MKKLLLSLIGVLFIFWLHAQEEKKPNEKGVIIGAAAMNGWTKKDTVYSFNIGSPIGYHLGNVTFDDTLDSIPDGVAQKGDSILQIGFPYNALYLEPTFNEELWVSKGYYPGYVLLKWEVARNANLIDKFEVYRNSILVATLSARSSQWQDKEAEPNVLHNYTLKAVGVLSGNLDNYNLISGAGFRLPGAIVTGRILYDGGNAVEGVKVTASTQSNVVANCLEISNDNVSLIVPDSTLQSLGNGFTIQSYLKFSSESNATIFKKEGCFSLSYKSNEFLFTVEGKEVKLPYRIPVDSFFHVSAFVDPGKDTMGIAITRKALKGIYEIDSTIVVGERFDELITDEKDALHVASNLSDSLHLTMDEVRLWNRALPYEEICENYKRIISPDADGLIAYWRMDEGFGNRFYDISHSGNNYNEAHGIITSVKDSIWTNDVPTENLLGFTAKTDKNGNYSIHSIPYGSKGTSYEIIPSYGQHQFDPPNEPLFVSEEASVHNQINFTDISSFTFSGEVYYKDTDKGVSGVNILVDNEYRNDKYGKPVVSDGDGKFAVEVPIGEHYISFEKGKHTFDRGARWPFPVPENPDSIVMHYFDQDIYLPNVVAPTDSTFISDTTLITVVGKVVGGTKGDDLPTGFGLSNNNIGKTRIILRHDNQTIGGYDNEFIGRKEFVNRFCDELIYLENTDSFDRDSAEVSFSVDYAANNTIIYPDEETGEFVARLIPEKFEYVYVELADTDLSPDPIRNYFDNQNNVLDLTQIPDTSFQHFYNVDSTRYKKNPELYSVDSVLTDSLPYHIFHKFEYRIKPEVSVTNVTNNQEFYGEKELYYKLPDEGGIDTINVKDNFHYPIFEMGKEYTARINVFEEYENYSNQKIDRQPVEDAKISISNKLAFSTSKVFEMEPEDQGFVEYTFRAGEPRITTIGGDGVDSTSFTKTMEVNVVINNSLYPWKPNGEKGDYYRAYVLGDKMKGNNFYTEGPEIPEIILHDPPGSNSYAYVEKGSSYSLTKNYSSTFTNGTGLEIEAKYGIKIEAGGGLVGPVVTDETFNSSTVGVSFSSEANEYGEVTETYEFNERIETSSDPEMVGEMADLYIGTAKNYYYGETDKLQLFSKEVADKNDLTRLKHEKLKGKKQYTLGLTESHSFSNDPRSTFFIYSQAHIIEELIPELESKKNELLINNPRYTLKTEISDLRHVWANFYKSELKSNGDTVLIASYVEGTDTLGLYEFKPRKVIFKDLNGIKDIMRYETDSIQYYNEQIKLWIDALILNEREKATAILNRDEVTADNISFDGGIGSIERSYSQTKINVEGETMTKNWSLNTEGSLGHVTNGFGVVTTPSVYMEGSEELGSEQSSEKSVTFGFVLDDDDVGDYYSVDILWKDKGCFIWSMDEIKNTKPGLPTNFDYSVVGAGTGLVGSAIMAGYAVKNSAGGAASAIATGVVAAGQLAGGITELAIFENEVDDREELVKIDANLMDVNVSSFSISSPMFSVIGGQSQCPFQAADSTMWSVDPDTKKPVPLHERTLKREDPIISINPRMQNNIPVGERAVFTLSLQNESDNEDDMWYTIDVKDGTNPHGAVIKIDGLNPNQPILIPGGGTVTKTLTVEPNNAEDAVFENIVILLHSNCQYDPTDLQPDIFSEDTISVSFQQSCSPITVVKPSDNWVVNCSDDGKLDIELTGYNMEMSSFKSIVLQHKMASGGDDVWSNKLYFVNDKDFEDVNADGDSIAITGPELLTQFDMLGYDEFMEHDIRFVTVCGEEPDLNRRYTDVRNGIIDINPPRVFGDPEPSTGIMGYGDNIKVRFNEPIESGQLSTGEKGNIKVKGTITGQEINHNAYVSFDGVSEYAVIPSGISLNDKSFTVECWINPESYNESVLFSQGEEDGNRVEIGLKQKNGKNQVYAMLGTRSFPGAFEISADLPIDEWYHLMFAYDYEQKQFSCYKDKIELFRTSPSFPVEFDFNTNDLICLGKGSDNTHFYNGSMHELRIWSKCLSVEESMASSLLQLTGNEYGLYGYWRMDEAWGSIVPDKASNRDMELFAAWGMDNGTFSSYYNSTTYLGLDNTVNAVTPDMDYTFEYWFKTNPSSWDGDTVCFFSNYSDLLSDGEDFEMQALSICGTSTGEMIVRSAGNNFNAASNNYFDGSWHHIAIVVRRRGTILSYIDGELQNEVSSNTLGGLSGENMILGALNHKNVSGNLESDKFLNGYIDEFRIWNHARSRSQIALDRNCRIEEKADGLLAYYPFETVSGINVNASLQGFSQYGLTENAEIFGSSNSEFFSSNSPGIKQPRNLQKLSPGEFEYITSEDEILININDNILLGLEKGYIDVFIEEVTDKHLNKMVSPETWMTYVHRNQVRWEDDSRTFTKEIYKPLQFVSTIKNTGGQNVEYSLKNLPPWLSAEPSLGTIKPESTVEIQFSVHPSLNIGTYTHDVMLSTGLGFNEKLPVTIKVYKTPPSWKVDPSNYEYSMSFVGKIEIEGVRSTDIFDMVAAFKKGTNTVCGVANVHYIEEFDSYYVFLNVYGNTNGEELEFRIWDASVGQILDNVSPFDEIFTINGIEGTTLSPIVFEAVNLYRQYIPLAEGWNWVSFNKESKYQGNLNNFFSSLEPAENDQIKIQNGFSQFTEGLGWNELSGIDSINNLEMYQMKISHKDTIIYTGSDVIPEEHPISLTSGWNNVGYLPDLAMEVDDALRYYSADTSEIIKSQYAFAMYDPRAGWLGTLETMQPGLGYMMKVLDVGVLKYPNTTVYKSGHIPHYSTAPLGWNTDLSQYQSNVSIVAEIDVSKVPEVMVNSSMVLGAFINDENHGFVSPLVNSGLNYELFFLSVSNSTSGEPIQFILYDGATGNTYRVKEKRPFVENAVYGSINAPLKLTLQGIVTGGGFMENEEFFKCYPNPFDKNVTIEFAGFKGEVTVDVMDATGARVARLFDDVASGGTNKVIWNGCNEGGRESAAGMYYVRFIAEDEVKSTKISKSR